MDTIERILNGSGELFLRSGIKSITMDDIAKNLGISKKTIYQHFADKNDLVVAVVKNKLVQDKEQMKEILESDENVIEQLYRMAKCSEEVLVKIHASAFLDMKKYHPDAYNIFRDFKRDYMVQMLEDILNKGIKQGLIREDIDARVVAQMRVNQIEMGFDTELFPPTEYNVWKVQQQLQDMFNYGICTLKGYKLLNQYKNIHEEEELKAYH